MTLEARISRRALVHNLQALSERSAPAAVMFVVKANGYGHGTREVSEIAYEAGIRHYGCLEIETAIAVREVVPDPEVMLLAWQFSEHDDLTQLVTHRIDIGVGSHDLLDLVEKAAAHVSEPIRVQLKVDTGLSRNGFPQSDWDSVVARVSRLERDGLLVVSGVWTHIAETSDDTDRQAHHDFEKARHELESTLGRTLFAHLAASSASFRLPEFRFDAVRVGGHAYGIPSFDDVTPADIGLVPVMTLVGDCDPDSDDEWGDVTSVDGGFVDGVPSYATGNVSVTIGGVRHPVLAVLEDEIILGGNPSESTAYLFGDGSHGEQTVREWGDAIGTLGDEITCRIPATIPRRLVD